jgi:hypothetical protein
MGTPDEPESPSENGTGTEMLENRIWAAVGRVSADSGFTSAQYFQPVRCLIFLRSCGGSFLARRPVLAEQLAGSRAGTFRKNSP